MEMPPRAGTQSEPTKIYLESILGRLRQISREISHLRTSNERLESKVDELHYRLSAKSILKSADQQVREVHRISESDKDNTQLKKSFAMEKASTGILGESKKKQRQNEQVQNENEIINSIPTINGFAGAESAIKKVQEIQARQQQGRFPKFPKSSRRKLHSKESKGYWKLDFTDTSTQSP